MKETKQTIDIKYEIFEALGQACGKCGYDYSPAALNIVGKGGERRDQKEQYAIWMSKVLVSVTRGRKEYALWCLNCLAATRAEEEAAALAAELAAQKTKPLAIWKTDQPKASILQKKSMWMERKVELGVDGFVVVEGGEVYRYDPSLKWEKAEPVAPNWKEFAEMYGWSGVEPVDGTVLLRGKDGGTV